MDKDMWKYASYRKGYEAFAMNILIVENPYVSGTQQWFYWNDGWRDHKWEE